MGFHVECVAAFFPREDDKAAIEMVCRELPYLVDDRRAVWRRSGFCLLLAAHNVGAPVKNYVLCGVIKMLDFVSRSDTLTQ